MADATYGNQGVYREQGGNRFVVASSGSLDVESGGEIDIEAGGRLEVGGTPLITSGGLVDLSSAISKTTGMYSTGTVTADAFTSTGGTDGSGKFNSVTSTGTGRFNAVTSTGTGTFNAVTSTGTGTFNAVSSTGTVTAVAFVSTGSAAFASTGGTITGGQITAYAGFVEGSIETLGSSAALLGYGISIVATTSGGGANRMFTLAAPVAGRTKEIICIDTTAATLIITSSGAGAAIGGNTSILISTGLSSDPEWVRLVGQNSTNWLLLGCSTDVTFSAT